MLFRFGCALLVTMATRHVDLQCVLFLNHGKEVLIRISIMVRDFYISPQQLLKLISKHKNSKIVLFSLGCELFVAMVTRYINLQIVLFLKHSSLSMMMGGIYISLQKLLKLNSKHPK